MGEPANVHSQNARLVALLEQASVPQPWWMGFLETGASDVVFPSGPRVQVYTHGYVIVQADPARALTWRPLEKRKESLPDPMFPLDRSWLISTLWDDDWRYAGGSAELADALATDQVLQARPVVLGENSIPPGRTAI